MTVFSQKQVMVLYLGSFKYGKTKNVIRIWFFRIIDKNQLDEDIMYNKRIIQIIEDIDDLRMEEIRRYSQGEVLRNL